MSAEMTNGTFLFGTVSLVLSTSSTAGSSGKGAPAYLVTALIPVYSTLFLMAPCHLDRSKLTVLDLHSLGTNTDLLIR